MNYTELKEQVANHFVSMELVPFVPTAIEMAEAALNRQVRTRDMLSRSYIALSVSGRYVALPDDFLEARTVYITSGGWTERLEFLTVERMQEWKGVDRAQGRPAYYSVLGDEIELLPAPSDTFDIDMVYYQRIPKLDGSNATNWLIDSHPDAYLYGTLLQASPYLDKDRRIPTWQLMYDAALESLRLQNERSEFPGGTLKARAKPL